MREPEAAGRPNQRNRTRKDLLRAAADLMKQGKSPSLEEVAQEAMVSRATAYRYFPSVDALLIEAAVDIHTPDPDDIFDGTDKTDPIERVERVDAALHDMLAQNEASIRLMLAQSLSRPEGGGAPRRQNRRLPLLDAALAPAKDQFKPVDLKRLAKALALITGAEGYFAGKDVLELDDTESRKLKRWIIRALIEASRK
ncbi:MAG: TetR/AcrR family transcriptional regulator [Caulobacterales bacterium]